MRLIGLLAMFFWTLFASASDIIIEANNPRPFGYIVGDTFEQTLELSAKNTQILDEKSLPKPGRMNAWLELRDITVTETASAGRNNYRAKLRYQIPNAPTEIRVIELPSHRFSFSEANQKPVEVRSTEWPMTIGPITPAEVLARDGLEALRPDVAPQLIDTTPIQQRMLLSALALGALLIYWVYRHFGIPFLASQQRPFTRTYRELNRLNKENDLEIFPKAIEKLHRALNETAGKSLFTENIEQFLGHRSIPDGLADKTREFFQISRVEFFGGGAADSQRSLSWALDFCRAWRDVERGAA
jgi:mxaA protein